MIDITASTFAVTCDLARRIRQDILNSETPQSVGNASLDRGQAGSIAFWQGHSSSGIRRGGSPNRQCCKSLQCVARIRIHLCKIYGTA